MTKYQPASPSDETLEQILHASLFLDEVENALSADSSVKAALIKLQIDAGLQYQAQSQGISVSEVYASSENSIQMRNAYTLVTQERIDKIFTDCLNRLSLQSPVYAAMQHMVNEVCKSRNDGKFL